MEPLNIPRDRRRLLGTHWASLDRPRLRDEALLEEAHGIAIGHPGNEVAGGGVNSFLLHRPEIKKFIGPLVHLRPESAQYVFRFLELGRRDAILVDRLEEELSKIEHGVQYGLTHSDLLHVSLKRGRHDILDQRSDASRGGVPQLSNRSPREILDPQ